MKLKPAKQALADTIHQSGGWPSSELWDFATSNAFGEVLLSASNPERKGNVWVNGGTYKLIVCTKGPIRNWHQTCLSRDEYFTAYPEQVKVEVGNETEHKVEAEMTSDKEITIRVSDWYKNGEFPPVGEFCEAYFDYPPRWIETEIVAHKGGFFIGWCESEKDAFRSDFVDGLRPLRTERDKAIDEMVDCLGSRWANCEEIAAHLYENGYRKEVK